MRLRPLAVPATLIVLAFATPRPAAAQEPRAPAFFDTTGTAWAYASYFRVPWPRVDSLIKLERYRPAIRARAQALGCYLDSNILIHYIGNEYNVVTSTTYASFPNLAPGGNDACTARARREAVPDSTLRAAILAGNNWVYGDAAHYDVIYWVPYPGRR